MKGALTLIAAVAVLTFLPKVSGHARLVCPPPRSPDTGAKSWPCGHPDDLSIEPLRLEPGPNTIVWEESVYHFAAPARLALSSPKAGDEASDDKPGVFEKCVLLDHIPHGDVGDRFRTMNYSDESTVSRCPPPAPARSPRRPAADLSPLSSASSSTFATP